MPTAAYHHGDLPNALRAAAAELIAEKGAAGFSLREVARRAGVSHAAPAHHFGDAGGLLTAVAVEGFEHLAAETRAAAEAEADPVDALVAVGRAYVHAARLHPGHCQVMFRKDLVDEDDPVYEEAGQSAFAVLAEVLGRLRDERNPDLDVELASLTCWAAVQGLVELRDNMASLAEAIGSRDVPPLEDLAEVVTRQIVDGLAGRERPSG